MSYPLSYYPSDSCAFAFELDAPASNTVDCQVLWDFSDSVPSCSAIADVDVSDEKDDHKSPSMVFARSGSDHFSYQVAA